MIMNDLGVQKVFRLKCSAQHNAWGKTGMNSTVAQLLSSDGCIIEADKPYAELWMGTHSIGPSRVFNSGQSKELLNDWIIRNPDCLRSSCRQSCDGNLPFLFKVLSINTALAIQAHPNKVYAAELHRKRPDIYKDPNPKPEMAIALTPFKAMVGFRPIREVADFVTKIEPLQTLIGTCRFARLLKASMVMKSSTIHNEAMEDCLRALLSHDKIEIQKQVYNLLDAVKKREGDGEDTEIYMPDVIRRLNRDYPGDVGIFMVYFLNIIDLEPSEAVFIDANVPHAYLSGDCIECMVCSDNVVRAGLTYKYRDVETFCGMIDYTGRPANQMKMKPSSVQMCQPGLKETHFQPSIPDFAISLIEVTEDCELFNLKPIDSASILLVHEGEGRTSNSTLQSTIKMRKGTVLFISAGEMVKITKKSSYMLLFRSYSTPVI